MKVTEKTPSVINNKEKLIKINTAALSYGNISFNDKDIKESRAVTLFNKAASVKNFTVAAKFQSNLRGSKDASKNGVTVTTSESVKLKGYSSKKINVTLSIPKSAEKGIYEGYLVVTNAENPAETYQVPFGVHYVDRGFESMGHGQGSISTSLAKGTFKERRMFTNVVLKSHMRTIDVVVSDADIGVDLGVIGTIDGIGRDEGVPYSWVLWSGYYYPFTNDDGHPISAKAYAPKEGHYNLKLIGTDDAGKTYTITKDFFVDNQMPSYDVQVAGEKAGNPFIEVEPGQQFVDMTASIFDKNVAVRKAAGFQADQSQNSIWYYYNSLFPTAKLTLDENGQVKDQIAMLPSQDVLPVMFEGIDEATNTAGQKQYIFIRNDVSYVYGQPDGQTRLGRVIARPGDTVKITLTGNNVSTVLKANYNFTTNNGDTNIVDISLNPVARDLGGTLAVVTTNPTTTSTKSDVTVAFDGNKEVSGDVPTIDVTLKLTNANQTSYALGSSFSNVKSTFTSVGNVVTSPLTYVVPIGIMQDYTKVNGYIHPEGLQGTDGLLDQSKDFTKAGVVMSVQDYTGKSYLGSIDTKGQFFISGLPVTTEDFKVIQDVPGHFTTYGGFSEAYQIVDEIVYGTTKYLGTEYVDVALGGDVNKDNVIDVNDALAIQTYWQTNKRSADINFDGTVDAKDLAFVERNYLTQNVTVSNPPKAVKKAKGATLESIKALLGIK